MNRTARVALSACWIAAPLGLCVLLAGQPDGEVRMGQFVTRLEGRTPNQRANATLAMRTLDGEVIAPGETLSFNGIVGSWSRDTGYKKAPVSFSGQLVSAFGGGVCQTSTTLYNAALLSGLEVTERHQHRHAPGYVAPGRDAAVAFHGLDLKIRNPYEFPVRVSTRVRGARLEVSFFGRHKPEDSPRIMSQIHGVDLPGSIKVNPEGRFGNIRNGGKAGFDVTTYLIVGDRKTLLARSSYPSMERIVEYRE